MKSDLSRETQTAPASNQPEAEPFSESAQRAMAARLARGVGRFFEDLGHACLTEVSLANGRRADVMALDGKGRIAVIEIKSCLADFRSDGKWHEYREFCDALYFGVAAEFPREVLPEDCGVIVADAYGAAIERAAAAHPLNPARRRAVTLRFAQAAARRLSASLDPR
ncbi:MAG: MmcB family DNA repair protein [Rhodovibrionaceae bacterium]